jgi:hypothetical protein
MIVAWNGRGGIIALVAAGCLLATDYFTGLWYRNSHFYQDHGWPKLAGFWAAAIIVHFLSRRPDEVLTAHPDPQRQPVLRAADTLFFIPASRWPLILGGLGIVCYFLRG